MQEELITFKTAVLAKEKGFDELTIYSYGKTGSLYEKTHLINLYKNSTIIEGYSTAPSQSLLQRWLRETFKLWVWVEPDKINKKGLCTYFIESEDKTIVVDKYADPDYKTWVMANKNYYEALETALQKALKLLT